MKKLLLTAAAVIALCAPAYAQTTTQPSATQPSTQSGAGPSGATGPATGSGSTYDATGASAGSTGSAASGSGSMGAGAMGPGAAGSGSSASGGAGSTYDASGSSGYGSGAAAATPYGAGPGASPTYGASSDAYGAGGATGQSATYGGPSANGASTYGSSSTLRTPFYARIDAGLGFAGKADFNARTTGTGQPLSFSQDKDFDLGWQVGAAVGVANFPLPNWRVELEGVYANNETDDSKDNFDDVFDTGNDNRDDDTASADVTVYGALVNLVYDFDFGANWRPYVGAGAGYGNVRVKYAGVKADDDVFIWQAKAGVAYALSPTSAIELGYRYLDSESANFDSDNFDLDITGEVDTRVHAVTVGYRFGF